MRARRGGVEGVKVAALLPCPWRRRDKGTVWRQSAAELSSPVLGGGGGHGGCGGHGSQQRRCSSPIPGGCGNVKGVAGVKVAALLPRPWRRWWCQGCGVMASRAPRSGHSSPVLGNRGNVKGTASAAISGSAAPPLTLVLVALRAWRGVGESLRRQDKCDCYLWIAGMMLRYLTRLSPT